MKSNQEKSRVNFHDLHKAGNGRFLWTVISVLLFGLIAYAYGLLTYTPSHDSLREFCADAYSTTYGMTIRELKLVTGRFLEPVYWDIFRGSVLIPWLDGILGILWIALAVFFLVEIFDIKKKSLIVLTAGIMTVNLTTTATFLTYLTDFDPYMLSLLFAVLFAYFWAKGGKWCFLGIPFAVCSMGLYQVYIAVALTVVCMLTAVRLYEGQEFRKTMLELLKAAGLLLASVALYFGIMKLTSMRLPDSVQRTGVASAFLQNPVAAVRRGYGYYVKCFISGKTALSGTFFTAVNILLLLTGIFTTVRLLISRSRKTASKIVFCVICILLPLCMNFWEFLTCGNAHDLMYYSIWLTYVFILILANKTAEEEETGKKCLRHGIRTGAFILVGVVIFGNIRFANAAEYARKIGNDQAQSLLTRVEYDLEHTEGYVPDKTQVLFIGVPDIPRTAGFAWVEMTGTGRTSTPIYHSNVYDEYFRYVLNSSLRILDDDELRDELFAREDVKNMPNYPAKGSIVFMDDLLVIKMSNFIE